MSFSQRRPCTASVGLFLATDLATPTHAQTVPEPPTTSLAFETPLHSAVRLALAAEDADGYVKNTALHRTDTAGWRGRFARLKLLHIDDAGGEWRLGLQSHTHKGGNDFFVTPEQAPTHTSTASDAGRNDTASTLLAASYDRRYADGRRLAVTLGGTEARWHYWAPQSVYGGTSGLAGRTRQYSAELRMNSAAAASAGIDWMAGVYASHLNKSAPFLVGFAGGYFRSATTAQIRGTTTAVFGELGWRFAPQWRLAAALRLEHDRRSMDWSGDVSGYYDSDGDGKPDTPFTRVGRLQGLSSNDTVPLPRLTLEWRPTEQQYLWATLARGDKTSGFNHYANDARDAATPYAPEYANHWELGWRMRGDANVSYRSGRWTLGLYGKNLSNARYLVRAMSFGRSAFVVAGTPRSVALRTSLDF